MTADVGVSDEAAAPLLPAARHIHQSEPHVMQSVRINTLYSNKGNKGSRGPTRGFTSETFWIQHGCSTVRKLDNGCVDITCCFCGSPASCHTRPALIQLLVIVRETHRRYTGAWTQKDGHKAENSEVQKVCGLDQGFPLNLAGTLRRRRDRSCFGGKLPSCGRLKTSSTGTVCDDDKRRS